MKTKNILIVLSFLLFNACIIKSLHPFYTKTNEHFSENLLGNFSDDKDGDWEIKSFKSEFEKENKGNILKPEDLKIKETYKKAYVVKYTKSKNEATFIAMPFKVDDHLFLDLTPFDFDSSDLNTLVGEHLLKTHSATYVQFNTDKTITLKWLSESVIGDLITNNKLRIKYETTGLEEDLFLTASSEELHNFLKKFMKMDIKDKWDNDVIKTLTPIHAKP
jgi:hypothetical protein